MGKIDVHGAKPALSNRLQKIRKGDGIIPENKELILGFHEYSVARGLSDSRLIKYLDSLPRLSETFGKPFGEVTKEDVQVLLCNLEKTQYSEWTKKDYKVILKRFFKWFKGNDEEYPKEVRWIKARIQNGRHKLPEELLTADDVKALSMAARHPRDKAFVEVLYESGCRIGELLTLTLRNVKFDEYGAVLRVSGKTGDRRVRILASAPSLASWLNMHPLRSTNNSPLWLVRCDRYGPKHFSYPTAMLLLRKLAKRAGITKRVNPHAFRHSRATSLANKLTEAQMKEFFGWTQSSDMAAVYVHLSGRDVDDALLRINGVKDSEIKPEAEKFKSKPCPRCDHENSPTSKFCAKCGSVLDLTTALTIEDQRKGADDIMNRLLKDPQTRDFLVHKITELGMTDKVIGGW